MNALTWLLWAGAALTLISSTRNPWYLGIAVLSVLTVHLSVASWSAVRQSLVIGSGLSVVGVLFNVLTAHVGDRVMLQLPASWPIVGGPLTLNALVYGLCTALALTTTILVGATVYAALDGFEILRLIPPGFSSVAVALALAGTIFPAAIRAFHDIREAQAIRGIPITRSVRLTWLLSSMLHRGFTYALALAETLECRGYGRTRPSWKEYSALGCLLCGTLGLILGLLSTHRTVTGIAIGLVLLGLGLFSTLIWSRILQLPWNRPYRLSLATTILSLGILWGTLLLQPQTLQYSTYPTLTLPPLALHPSLAAALLALPTLTIGTEYGNY
jgi:energy-coupling factor transport system permease protein